MAISIRTFDKLNNITTRKVLPIRQYFEEMELSEYEIERRIALAEEIRDELEGAFAYILSTMDVDTIDEYEVSDVLQRRIGDALDFCGVDPDKLIFLANYLQSISDELAKTTVKNIEEPYYTSTERATFVAENEANAVYNDVQIREAMESGYTHKTWVTMRDRHVRDTHYEVDGETIEIDELFVVGDSLMVAPKILYEGDASEVVNCRCSLEFSINNEKKYDKISLNEEFANDKIVIPDAKITKYLLDPSKKHAQEFFNVGYTQDNPKQLYDDLMKIFDPSKAEGFKETEYGKSFNISVELGVTKTKPFNTVWMYKVNNPDIAVFITAYRISG